MTRSGAAEETAEAGLEPAPASEPAAAVTDAELQAIGRVLRFGAAASRAALADELARQHGPGLWEVLANTVRSDDDWQLRARSLELLGLIAGSADRATAEAVLAATTRPS